LRTSCRIRNSPEHGIGLAIILGPESNMSLPRTIGALLVVLAAAASVAAPPVAPGYKRDKGQRPEVRTPAPPRAPEGLIARRAVAAAVARRPIPADPSSAELRRAGYQAGRWAADALARTAGRREAFRVGFWEGQRAAFADPEVGRWERADGLRAGRLDPAALDYGAREGERAAYENAPAEARASVERQFSDLAWRPLRSPRPGEAAFRSGFPATVAPTLEVVFREVSIGAPRAAESFRGWNWDPYRLHGCEAWNTFYDASWQNVDRALAFWSSDPSRASFWRRLDGPAPRDDFRAAFEDGFWDGIETAPTGWIEAAHAEGFEDGWYHGAAVRGEWAWRQGYAEGFDRALAFAAEIAYDHAYPRAFTRAYDEEFDAWMTTARPAILDARLRDGNDDGVFQPGEPVEVSWTIANLGGAAGSFTVAVDGGVLGAPASATVNAPARRRIDGVRPIVVKLDPNAAAPADENLVLEVGGQKRSLPLRVAFPVEFTGEIDYRSRPLEGRADVAFEVENRSRKPVEGIEVVLDGGDRRALGRLDPGESTNVAFELDGVRPLDLLSGALAVKAQAFVGGEPWDGRVARFPELATDLTNPALPDYLVALGRERDPDPGDVAQARRLLAQRLAADWDVARRGDGNPYKEDAQDGGTRTALAELVAAYTRDRGTLSRSIVFHGLGDEVAARVEELPGANPLLRKWARRLAGKLE
jgi:hypothetical protein